MTDQTKVLLQTNQLYTMNGSFNYSVDNPPSDSMNCAGDICTGIIVGIEIPLENNMDSTGLRVYSKPAEDLGIWQNSYTSLCLPTEKFDENYLREFVFKFSILNANLSETYLSLDRAVPELVWESELLTDDIDVPASAYNTGASLYQLNFWDLPINNYSWTLLVPHQDTTYPSPNNMYYLDANLEENTDEPQNIKLTLFTEQSLVYQPFTGIRGGLIEGSDSIRHNFSLENEGGNLCLPIFIDLTFGNQEQFIYKGGSINFGGKNSCLQFMHGGKLVVADNTTFHYGHKGMGMLALRQGGTIELGKNSTLIIDNTLTMFERRTDEPQQIYMTLNPQSSLIFTENARLTNQFSIDKKMKLNIFMNGGVLDDSRLSPEERALINRIYPSDKTTVNNSSFVYPNPASEYTVWAYHAASESEVQLSIYDSNGRLIHSQLQDLKVGPNETPIDLRSFADGVYYLKWKTNEASGTVKWIKI